MRCCARPGLLRAPLLRRPDGGFDEVSWDEAFAFIEIGGSRDPGGKTVPRSKRHFPVNTEIAVRATNDTREVLQAVQWDGALHLSGVVLLGVVTLLVPVGLLYLIGAAAWRVKGEAGGRGQAAVEAAGEIHVRHGWHSYTVHPSWNWRLAAI